MLKMYIGGRWVSAVSGRTRSIINPATGEQIDVAAEGGAEDARLAIAAARKAFDESDWPHTSARHRARLLFRLADLIERHAGELARMETENNGKPLADAEDDVLTAANVFRYYAGLIGKPSGQVSDLPGSYVGRVVREPIGVCGLIVPWNFPLMMASWKLAPCLAAGNTCVFKPAELTPVTAVRLFELMEEAGFPPGVANLLLGEGRTAGAELAAHEQVDKIAFTGGTETGRGVMRAAAENIKKLSLELGGKSANIVFADADLDIAADYAVSGIFLNAGQVCSAGSRLLVEESVYDRFVGMVVERARKIRVGNGLHPGVEMGPLISEAHMNKVLGYIKAGIEEGAVLLTGGKRITEGELARGFFVEPTVFGDVHSGMRIFREEIFGPVLSVTKFRDEEDAVRLANDSIYGLAGAVFTSDAGKAERVARRVRVGVFWINVYHPAMVEMPWGGYKQSGLGRELGTFGLDAFTEVKQIVHNLHPGPLGYYHWNRS